MTFGSAIHKALEVYYNTGNQKLAEETFIQYFTDNSKDVALKRGESLEREGKIGVKMLNEYFKPDNKPYFNPSKVEYKFQTILKDPITHKEIGVPVKGIIDVITTDDFIVDRKTSASMWTEEMIDKDLQKIFYALAFKSIFGREPKGFIYNFLIKRVGQPKFDNQSVEINTGQMVYCIDYVNHVVKRIKNEEFPKNITKNCRYCPHRHVCLN